MAIPSTIVDPGAYLLVFASRKDRAISGQELHTNFALDGDGEELILVRSDGLTIIDSLKFPGQRTDHSYGRSSGTSLLHFPNPTPCTAKGNGVPRFVELPEIQTPRGI